MISPDLERWGARVRGRSDEAAVSEAFVLARAFAASVPEVARPRVTFLIDECVSPLLEQVANDFGFTAHVIHHRGWGELKDSQLYHKRLEHDLTLVTNNRDDWLHLIGGTELHPGLVVIQENAPGPQEIVFFAMCLRLVAILPSMANTVVEVDERGEVVAYDPPTE